MPTRPSITTDTRGVVAMQIAALILIPLVATIVAIAAIIMVRTGASLTEAFQRSTMMATTSSTMKKAVESSTTINPHSNVKFVTHSDPRQLPPGYVTAGDLPTVCNTYTWTLERGELDALSVRTDTHTSADCTSAVASTWTQTLTGLVPGSGFRYFNLAGRELVYTGGEAGFGGTARPVGVTTPQWDSTAIAHVTFTATAQQPFGDATLSISASTWR